MKNPVGALAQPAVGIMAFARFARDSPSSPEILLIGRPENRSILGCCQENDRSGFNSLANRVNAIDPYGIFRHHNTPCAIVNPMVLALGSEEHRSVWV